MASDLLGASTGMKTDCWYCSGRCFVRRFTSSPSLFLPLQLLQQLLGQVAYPEVLLTALCRLKKTWYVEKLDGGLQRGGNVAHPLLEQWQSLCYKSRVLGGLQEATQALWTPEMGLQIPFLPSLPPSSLLTKQQQQHHNNIKNNNIMNITQSPGSPT